VDDSLYRLHWELEQDHWWFAARRRIIVGVIDALFEESERRTLVDIGCGAGGTVAALRHRYRCHGLDAAEQAIAYARKADPEGSYILGGVPEALVPLAADAGIFSLLDVLEHVEEDADFLKHVVEAARPGTHILITVPARKDLWSRHDETNHHFRRYEKDELTALWRGLPVEPRFITFFNSRLFPLIWVVRSIMRLSGKGFGESDTDLRMPGRLVNTVLKGIFGDEAGRIEALARRRPVAPYAFGVSLMAVLTRQ